MMRDWDGWTVMFALAIVGVVALIGGGLVAIYWFATHVSVVIHP